MTTLLNRWTFGSLLTLAALASTPAHAESSLTAGDFAVSGFVEQLTDYRYRGVSQTAGDWSIQGQITVEHSSGFYANLWATNLEDSDVAGTTEWDAGIGWTGEILPNVKIDTGLYLFFFPNGKVGDADIFEPFVALSTKIGPVDVTTGAYYSWKQDSLGGDDNLYLSTELSAPIARTPVTLIAHVAYSDGALSPNRQTEKSMSGGFDYYVGASYQLAKNLTATATYVGVDGFSEDGFTNDTIVGSLKLSF